jgi:hypothetical protein
MVRDAVKLEFVRHWVLALARHAYPEAVDLEALVPAKVPRGGRRARILFEATAAAFFLEQIPGVLRKAPLTELIAFVQAHWSGRRDQYLEPDWILEKLVPADQSTLSLPAGSLLGSGTPKEAIRQEVIALYRAVLGDDESSEQKVLATDPNDFDLDPVELISLLERRYGVDFGDEYPGTMARTLAVLLKQWDGQKLRPVKVRRNLAAVKLPAPP